MRLFFAIDSLGSGGAQRQIVSLALGLARRGHTPVFCIYYPEHDYFTDELTAAGIQVRHLLKSSRFSLRPALAMRRMLRSEQFDAVLAFLPTPSFYAFIATRFPGHPPLITSERSTFEEDPPRLAARVRMHLVRFIDVVVANSHHHRQRMVRHFPWTAARVRTIWNGVDLERFKPGSEYHDRADRDALVAVGSVRPAKNARGLAQALVLLHERGRPVPKVRWAGKIEPTAASVQERDAVDALLAAAGIGDRWEWMGEHPNVSILLRSHAALIHPSLLEGLPNAVCESLASGLPVLAGAIGDQPQLVQDQHSGLLFDPTESASMARAIDRFFQLELPARAAMSRAARDFAEQALALSRVCSEYETILKPLVAAYRQQHGGSGSRQVLGADHLSFSEHQ